MTIGLEELLEVAESEARRAGFRMPGVYHLIRAVRLRDPDLLTAWLSAYQIDEPHFLKALENVLRARRAGGGVPRDRLDADLLQEAKEHALAIAAREGLAAQASHLASVWIELKEDPIQSLCERYCIDCRVLERV